MAEEKKSAVLFIHGFLGSPDFFNQFVPQIPKNYEIHKIRLCGHGGSVSDFAAASMEKWKNQVRQAVSDLASRYKKIIIIAHSMGAFFAIEAAEAFPQQVKGIFLLGVPLKIFVRPTYFLNGIKLLFNAFPKDDKALSVLKNALGVNLNKRVWEYSGWLPRGFEVLKESKRARAKIRKIEIPCIIFQSEHDEVVSIRSLNYIPKKNNIAVNILDESTHFMYSKNDFLKISKAISEFLL